MCIAVMGTTEDSLKCVLAFNKVFDYSAVTNLFSYTRYPHSCNPPQPTQKFLLKGHFINKVIDLDMFNWFRDLIASESAVFKCYFEKTVLFTGLQNT